jgi:DNA-binding NarL/FixJ family response regulator
MTRYELVKDARCRNCEDGWTKGKGTADRYTHGQDEAMKAKKVRELGVTRQTMSERELGQALDRLAAQWPSLRSEEEEQRFREKDAYGWELARSKQGSQAALTRALDELRIWSEDASRALTRGEPGSLVAAALYFLEARMPEPILIPQSVADTENSNQRSATIHSLSAAGKRPRQISRELGIDLRKVKAALR